MKLSIIIPVYNVKAWLDACLESLVRQDWRDWEAICVDDGSTDGSGGMLDSWAVKDGRFRVFHKENAGVSSARNFGIDQAKGDYIWFVDADDVVPSGALSMIAESLDKAAGCDILMLKWITFKDGSSTDFAVNAANAKVETDDLGSEESVGRFSFYVCNLVACNGLFRREKYAAQRFREYRNGEDSLWGFEALASAGKVAHLTEPAYAYRVRTGSARNTLDEVHLKCYFDVMGETIRIVCEKGLCDAYRKETERLARNLARGTCAWVAFKIGWRRGTIAWRECAEGIFGKKIEMGNARLFASVIFPGWFKFSVLHLPGMMKAWSFVKGLVKR